MVNHEVRSDRFSVVMTLTCLLGMVVLLLASAPNWATSVALEYKLMPLSMLGVVQALLLLRAGRVAEWLAGHPRSQRACTVVGVSVVCALVAGAAAELYLGRVAGLWYYPEARRYFRMMVDDPLLVYRHPAHLSHEFQGALVETDRRGYRTPEVADHKPPGTLRILSLGDSVAFGWGVSDRETYARQLEARLSQGSGLPYPVQVINTGHGSYNTVQEANLLLTEGLRLEPDLVILLLVDNDAGQRDLAHVSAARARTPPGGERDTAARAGKPWSEVLELHALDLSLFHYHRLRRLLGSGGAVAPRANAPEPAAPGDCRSPDTTSLKTPRLHSGAPDLLFALKRIQAVTEANEIPFLLFVLSSFRQHGFYSRLACNIRDLGVEPHMVDYGGDRISAFDAHPTPAGHEKIADQMAPLILDSLRGRAPVDWSARGTRWPASWSADTDIRFDFPRDAGEVEGVDLSLEPARNGIVLTKTGKWGWGLIQGAVQPEGLDPSRDDVEIEVVLRRVDRSVRSVTVRLGSLDLGGRLSWLNASDYTWQLKGTRPGRVVLTRPLSRRDDRSARSNGGLHRWDRTSWFQIIFWVHERQQRFENVVLERFRIHSR